MVDRELSLDFYGSGLLGGGGSDIHRVLLAAGVVGPGRLVDGGVGDRGGAVVAGGGALVVRHNVGVHGLALVRDLGHVAAVGVGGVLDHLEPAVRERHGVGAHHHALLVLGLGLGELGPAVGVTHSVLVLVGPGVTLIGGGVVNWLKRQCNG